MWRFLGYYEMECDHCVIGTGNITLFGALNHIRTQFVFGGKAGICPENDSKNTSYTGEATEDSMGALNG